MKIILPSLLYSLHALVWIQATVHSIKCYAEYPWTLKQDPSGKSSDPLSMDTSQKYV